MIRFRSLYVFVFVFLVACAASQEPTAVMPTTIPTSSSTSAVVTDTPNPPPTDIPTEVPTKPSTQIADPTPSQEPMPTASPEPFMTTAVIGQSANDNEITVTKLGMGETTVLLIGGLHAGFAPATVTLAEQVIAHFSENNQALPTDVTLYVVTNANPDSMGGETGEVNGRLNGNGVDLNRNWDCNWTADAQWRGQSVNGGSEPFSEPESQALRDLILGVEPEAVVVFEAVGGVVVPGVCDDYSVSEDLAAQYAEATGYQASGISGSTVTGDLTDWLNSQDIPSVAPLLSDYTEMDWEQNLAGIEAALNVAVNLKSTSAENENTIAATDSLAQPPNKEDEYAALVALYMNLDGENWQSNEGWLQSDDYCTWKGVQCTDGHVTALSINGAGKMENDPLALPSEIGDLHHLQSLDIKSACIGSLPPEIGHLINLEILFISYNCLETLPPEIGSLTNLTTMNLGWNELVSLPSEIGNLTNLTHLILLQNHINSLPSEIGNLTNLTDLNLVVNSVGSLPPTIGNLTNLTSLDLVNNKLTTLPSEIGNLVHLDYLNLERNDLNSLPPEIGRLTTLTDLNLMSNNLSSLPPEIGDLDNLLTLNLLENVQLSLPAEIGDLESLTHLYLEVYDVDSLPLEIGNLPNLTFLSLGDTSLNALPSELCVALPDDITLFPESLCASDTSESTIPTAIIPTVSFCANVTEIPQIECEALVTIYNELNGPDWTSQDGWGQTNTPCSWEGIECIAQHVTKLDVARYQLSGDIPAEIGNLMNLEFLNLSHNDINSIPPEIGNLSNLKVIGMNLNNLTHIPAEIGNLSNLTHITIDDNNLTHIPAEIGNLSNLVRISFEGNNLTDLPSEIGNFPNLTYLYLGHNEITNLPSEIGNLTNLEWLGLSVNSLSDIPPEIGNLSNLTILHLSNNNLNSLPPEIGNLSNLTELALDYNNIDRLPPELCTSLQGVKHISRYCSP